MNVPTLRKADVRQADAVMSTYAALTERFLTTKIKYLAAQKVKMQHLDEQDTEIAAFVDGINKFQFDVMCQACLDSSRYVENWNITESLWPNLDIDSLVDKEAELFEEIAQDGTRRQDWLAVFGAPIIVN